MPARSATDSVAGDSDAFLRENLSAMVAGIPLGLLLLDWQLQPRWFNDEGARACAVWNYGEQTGLALRERAVFSVPDAVREAAAKLRAQAMEGLPSEPLVISEHERGLYARISLHLPGDAAAGAIHVQLDYRRPRSDRDQPVSATALALFARLSTREREVALRIRDGLTNAQIAAELHRSPLTIKTQLNTIYGKLGVHSRTKASALLNR